MQTAHFTPHQTTSPASSLGCFTCTHNQGQLMAAHVVCERLGIQVVGTLKNGCAFWQREPGVDNQ